MIEFVKAHGTGNDFVVIEDLDDRLVLTDDAVRAICDRHFGIGADGIIRIAPGKSARFFMDYRNADGSIAEMCGNGVRVVGKWLGDRGHADGEVDLETRAGVKHLRLHRGASRLVESVTVDMGPPLGDVLQVELDVGTGPIALTLVSMGNPHAVTFVDDVDDAPVTVLGPLIERHDSFPNGTCVEFVAREDGLLLQRTWERGVGETLACGTGACAVAVAAAYHDMAGPSVEVELRGGRLQVERGDGGTMLMTGPAVEVFSGMIDLGRYI